jgi:hypothetical protein
MPDRGKAANWDQGLAPSTTAVLVKDWIERLKIDAEATLRLNNNPVSA